MNPYREAPAGSTFVVKARGKTRRLVRRKTAGYLLFTTGFVATSSVVGFERLWLFVPCGAVILIGMLMAFVGRSRSAFVRLCALTWNRGNRFGAALLLLGIDTPRYSKKRLARNAAALAAAQVGMPKVERWYLPK